MKCIMMYSIYRCTAYHHVCRSRCVVYRHVRYINDYIIITTLRTCICQNITSKAIHIPLVADLSKFVTATGPRVTPYSVYRQILSQLFVNCVYMWVQDMYGSSSYLSFGAINEENGVYLLLIAFVGSSTHLSRQDQLHENRH